MTLQSTSPVRKPQSEMSDSTANVVGRTSTTRSALGTGKSDINQQCGVLRFGRYQDSYTMLYRPRCGRRRCTVCLPIVINKKMARVPAEPVLYGTIVSVETFPRLRQQFAGARKRGEDGEYVRIPVSASAVLVVSPIEIGHSIAREVVEAKMLEALPEWGSITSSKGWRAVKTVAPEGFHDEGVCTSSVEWIRSRAELRHGLKPFEGAHTVKYLTSWEQHAQLREAAGVMTDADYWERMGSLSGSLDGQTRAYVRRFRAA